MLSQGPRYWIVLVVVSLWYKGTYTVSVKVQSTVVTDQSADQVILPCEYELDNSNQVYNIRWYLGIDTVMFKDSSGLVVYADKYTDRVKWGEGCSLVLLSPALNDTGTYWIKMVAPHDLINWDTANIQLIVIECGKRETTTAESGSTQSTCPTSTGTPKEDGGISPAREEVLHAAIVTTVINTLALIFQTLFLRTTEQNGRTDGFTRLCLGSPVVLFVIGAVTSVVSMIMRSNVAIIVSWVALGLGNGINGVFWIIKSKEIVGKNAKEVEEEREKMYLSSVAE